MVKKLAKAINESNLSHRLGLLVQNSAF